MKELDLLYTPQDGDPVELIEAYNSIKDDLKMLRALENAGVDNWEGRDFALELYNEEDE